MQIDTFKHPEISTSMPTLSHVKRFVFERLALTVRRSRITRKIAAGYAVTLGIATLGTILGVAIGDFYHTESQSLARKERALGSLLVDLKIQLLDTRIRQQRLPVLLLQPELYLSEHARFLRSAIQVEVLIQQVKSTSTARAIAGLDDLLQTHAKTLEIYVNELEAIVAQIDPSSGKMQNLQRSQAQLLQFDNSKTTNQMDALVEKVASLVQTSNQLEEKLALQGQQADHWRRSIVAATMLLSIAAAAAIAIRTSRMLTRPIKTLTATAEQVIDQSNFDVQVPVTSEDEIGTLTHSFNDLIQRIHGLLAEQKVQAERQAQLIHNEKMVSLGQMLAGVAHEINNPVNFISGNLEHTAAAVDDLLALVDTYAEAVPNLPAPVAAKAEEIDLEFLRSDLPQMVQSMQLGVDRVRQIVLSLRNFSRLGEATPHTVNLTECLDSTLLILNSRIKNKVEVMADYHHIPSIQGYSGLLYQVFTNFLTNALDAVDEKASGATKTIAIAARAVDPNWVTIEITDNGCGMDAATQTKMWDAFFTTKPAGVGTGLGLAISHQIVVEKHGGRLTCQSEVGKGTTFTIGLPIHN
jgi:signal transduction histidine kinase